MHNDSSFQQIVEVIGKDAANSLIRELPMASKTKTSFWYPRLLYVPKRLHGKWADRLVKIIGKDDASKMVEHYQGEILSLSPPRKPYLAFRNAAIRAQHEKGVSVKWLAFIFDMTPRQIRKIVAAT